jgi:hypothetical protein
VTDLRLAVALLPHKAGEARQRITWQDRPLAKWGQ